MKQNASDVVKNVSIVVGLFSGITTLAVPVVKEFALDHPLWGWVSFGLALIVLPLIVTHPAIKEAQTEAKAAQDEAAAQVKTAEENALAQEQAADVAARKKDLALLRERLKGWELDSWFFKYLTGAATHAHLAMRFTDDIEEHLAKWEFDAREIKDPEVQRIWEACVKTAFHYRSKIDDHMDMKASSQSYLQVPPEWEWADPIRHERAFKELSSALNCLSVAIRDAHRILH